MFCLFIRFDVGSLDANVKDKREVMNLGFLVIIRGREKTA